MAQRFRVDAGDDSGADGITVSSTKADLIRERRYLNVLKYRTKTPSDVDLAIYFAMNGSFSDTTGNRESSSIGGFK